MDFVKEKEIIFNVRPTSNVILGYAKNIKEPDDIEIIGFFI